MSFATQTKSWNLIRALSVDFPRGAVEIGYRASMSTLQKISKRILRRAALPLRVFPSIRPHLENGANASQAPASSGQMFVYILLHSEVSSQLAERTLRPNYSQTKRQSALRIRLLPLELSFSYSVPRLPHRCHLNVYRTRSCSRKRCSDSHLIAHSSTLIRYGT